jgi:FG-GAP repeat
MALRPLVLPLVLACCVPSASAAASAPYDFNGDGRQELVAGLPEIDDGEQRRAGAVLVVPGSSGGIDIADRRLVSQSRDGLPDGAEYADHFGGSVASGDFNADGYADLAVGAAETDQVDYFSLGGVTVMYGGAAGLSGQGATLFLGAVQYHADGGEVFPSSSGFGGELVVGDLNRDGADDLVVGASGESPRAESELGSGAVHLLFGGPTGLTREGERILGRPHRADHAFGAVLAVGDVNRDGHVDVVEGAPGTGFGLDYGDVAGHLSYCPGRPTGPTNCRSVSRSVRSGFGRSHGRREGPASLAVGDVTGDGYPDVVEGVPEDRWWADSTDRVPAGAVLIRRGTSSGPSRRVLRIDQASRGVPGRSERYDRFGQAVVVGQLDRDRFADIVVAATQERSRSSRRVNGRVTVLRGGPRGTRATGAAALDGQTRRVPKTEVEFGRTLALLDYDGDGRLDLTIGSPGFEDGGFSVRGSFVTLLGDSRGFSTRRALGIDWTMLSVGRLTETAFGTVLGR